MRVFVTGATGFIGTELVKELLQAGHQVHGLSRSEEGGERLKATGAEPVIGKLEDTDLLARSAKGMDAVVHLAFNHDDMTKFAESGENERKAIEAMGSALAPGAALIVTSGTGIVAASPGHVRVETDPPAEGAASPRQAEGAARAFTEKGLRVGIVRLPQVHDTRKQGLVTWLVEMARKNGVSAYAGDGANRWAAAPRADVALLYRLAVEKTGEGATVYHAVQEQGVSLRSIAETIGASLNLPVASLEGEAAAQHFGWMTRFAALDMPASGDWTQKKLGWTPTGVGLIEDLKHLKS